METPLKGRFGAIQFHFPQNRGFLSLRCTLEINFLFASRGYGLAIVVTLSFDVMIAAFLHTNCSFLMDNRSIKARNAIMASTEKTVAKRVNVSLSEETIALLQGIARRRGVSMTEAVRIAIKTEDYIEQQIESGGKILIEKPDKTMREVVFR
jgi:Ribbon-helix-helix protein, copG family